MIFFLAIFADFADFAEEAVFVKSKSGNALLLDKEGNLYQINNRSKKSAKIWWKCRECRSNKHLKLLKSSGNAVTNGNYVISWSGQHNHIVSGLKANLEI